ncbi:MAG: glycine--tRNA ligase subunit beta [Burkholderiales bacterium]|nr:glycine--tRNA ligase subunit beta [Burkholderiales bacterium]
MTHEPLLIELLCEELPPKALQRLSESLGAQLHAALSAAGFIAEGAAAHTNFATPRRLAVRFPAVRAEQQAREVTRKGPSVQAGLDAAGQPSGALRGFARSCGVAVEALERITEAKAEYFVYRSTRPGEALAAHLPVLLAEALKKLPIPKLMRWGSGEAQFVRPVHQLVMLHGSRIVLGSVLGIESGRTTRGHRFQGKTQIVLEHALQYERALLDEGKVTVNFQERRESIARQLHAKAGELDAVLSDPDSLLDEVTALVEQPCVYAGGFDRAFLAVPQECLMLTMRQNQKYFPLLDRSGKLLPAFLIVSNMCLDDPGAIIHGNERVVRPRLADARFFFEQDKKIALEQRLGELDRMVYHNKLGSQRERVQRLRTLAADIGAKLGADALVVDRAALLCKADLATGMVGEFPELQGIMGRYYAIHDGDTAEVGQAIEQHYRPRYAADALPDAGAPAVVALADKLDILVGIYGIGLVPSGDRDPFALRRHGLGVLRILVEYRQHLGLYELLAAAREGYGTAVALSDRVAYDLVDFILDRALGYFRELGYAAEEIESVLDLYRNHDLPADQLQPRLEAIKQFRTLPEAASLIEANKRSRNIVAKEKVSDLVHALAPALLREPSEQALYAAMAEVRPLVQAHVERNEFSGALRALARLREPVDRFFTEVRVVVPDEALRTNRFALLTQLNHLLNQVANISRLPA